MPAAQRWKKPTAHMRHAAGGFARVPHGMLPRSKKGIPRAAEKMIHYGKPPKLLANFRVFPHTFTYHE